MWRHHVSSVHCNPIKTTIINLSRWSDCTALEKRSGEKLKTPSLSVNNNAWGAGVNIISQVLVVLTHGKRECQAVVLVQVGATLQPH